MLEFIVKDFYMVAGVNPNSYFNAWPDIVPFEGDKMDGIRSFLEGYFQRKVEPNLYLLKGGHSGSKNYLVEVDGTPYVLRIQNPNQLLDENRKELVIFEEAARAGIAPKIYAVSLDFSYSLIEYIRALTLPIERVKNAIPACAKALSRLHSLQIPDRIETKEGIADQLVTLYGQLKGRHNQIPEIERVIEEIQKNERNRVQATSVWIHGDLHLRNLFLIEGKALIVDWEMAAWDDPFHDLSYFANIVGLETNDEREFLRSYLQREPSEEEARRYFFSKKATLLLLAFNCFAQGYESAKMDQEVLNKDNPLFEMSHYQKGWAEKGEHPAQFFYDWGRQCLKRAKGI